MSAYPYTSPVNKLFQQGDPDLIQDWSSYLNLGITVKHIDELAQMAIDRTLFDEEDASWAPVHAWRTLAMLQDKATIKPLIDVFWQLSDNDLSDDEDGFDWVSEELPLVFGKVGRLALPELGDCLADVHASNRVRENAVMAIAEIAGEDRGARSDCMAILTKQLEKLTDNDADLNGFLVTVLVGSLRAVESADVIEQAFLADRVTADFIQNWDEAQVFLGLKEAPNLSDQLSNLIPSPPQSLEPKGINTVPFYSAAPKSKAQAKRKTQNQSRKKNRKKK